MSTRPIVMDTNILKNISEGNQALADALNAHLRARRKVTIARPAYNELIGGAGTLKKAGEYAEMVSDLKIEIAEAGAAADRQNFLADNIARTPKKNQPGQIDEYGSVAQDPPRPGDVFVAAQAKALDAELWTQDKTLRSRAAALGVRILKPDIPSVPGGNDDPNLGRRFAGNEPKARRRGRPGGDHDQPGKRGQCRCARGGGRGG